MPEFLELCRLLASFDTVHTYIDADDDDYDAFSRSSSFLRVLTYSQLTASGPTISGLSEQPAATRSCGFLEIWARVADLPEEWQRHDQALLAGFLEESPWNLKQVVPSDWCACVWITGLPPSAVKRATSLKARSARQKWKERWGRGK